MSFPHLFSCPFVVQRAILNLMSPDQVIFLAMTSTKSRKALASLNLGKKKAEISFHRGSETRIRLNAKNEYLADCQTNVTLAESQLLKVFQCVGFVYQISHIVLFLGIEPNGNYEALERGLEFWRNEDSKLCIDKLFLMSFGSPREPCEPPSFLDHLALDSVFSRVRFSRVPDFIKNAFHLDIADSNLEDLLSLECRKIEIFNELADDDLFSFLNHWKTSPDMDHWTYFQIRMQYSNFESLMERLGAVQSTFIDEDDIVCDIWKVERCNGVFMKFEKLGHIKCKISVSLLCE